MNRRCGGCKEFGRAGSAEGGRVAAAHARVAQGQRTFGFQGSNVPVGFFFHTQACRA